MLPVQGPPLGPPLQAAGEPAHINKLLRSWGRGGGGQPQGHDQGWMPLRHRCPPTRHRRRQLACARIGSKEGQDYLKAMACAANYAWVNRSSMTFLARQVGGGGEWEAGAGAGQAGAVAHSSTSVTA